MSSRYWRKRPSLPKREPLTSTEAVQSLQAALRDYYVAREGRGRHCHVDVYKRRDAIYYYAFLEDYPKLGGTFDEQGQYHRQIAKDNRLMYVTPVRTGYARPREVARSCSYHGWWLQESDA